MRTTTTVLPNGETQTTHEIGEGDVISITLKNKTDKPQATRIFSLNDSENPDVEILYYGSTSDYKIVKSLLKEKSFIFDIIREHSTNQMFLEQSLFIHKTNSSGHYRLQPHHPVCHFSPYQQQNGIVDMRMADETHGIIDGNTEVEIDLAPSGTKHLAFLMTRKDYVRSGEPKFVTELDKMKLRLDGSFPLWIENTTDEPIIFKLKNDSYEDLQKNLLNLCPEGLNASLNKHESVMEFLANIFHHEGIYEVRGMYFRSAMSKKRKEILEKIKTVLTGEEFAYINSNLNSESSAQMNARMLCAQGNIESAEKDGYKWKSLSNNLSPYQIQTSIVHFGPKQLFLDLSKNDDGTFVQDSIIEIEIMPRTKVALIGHFTKNIAVEEIPSFPIATPVMEAPPTEFNSEETETENAHV